MFEQFPYSNLHNLNLDWLLTKVKKLEAEIQHIPAGQKAYLVTPQQFGAVGDGVTDDTMAWRNWERSTDGLKYIPSGDYVVDGVSTHYDGQIGNQIGYQHDDPWWYMAGLNENTNVILNRRTASAVNNGGDSAQIQLYEEYNYTDTTSTYTENFYRGASVDSNMIIRGYTANGQLEAPTQHIGNIVGKTYSYMDGLVGTSAIYGRAYAYPGPYNATYGGSKIHALGAMTRDYVDADARGYSLGAEIDLVNDIASNIGKIKYDPIFGNTERKYEGMIIGGGGAAPIHNGIRLTNMGPKDNEYGMLVGIKFSKLMHRINHVANEDNDNLNRDSDGHEAITAGIDSRSWTPSSRGKYMIYAGHAHRHFSSLGGTKFESDGAFEFMRSSDASAILRIVGAASESSNKYAAIELITNNTDKPINNVYNFAGSTYVKNGIELAHLKDGDANVLRVNTFTTGGRVDIYPEGTSKSHFTISKDRIDNTVSFKIGTPDAYIERQYGRIYGIPRDDTNISALVVNIANKLNMDLSSSAFELEQGRSDHWLNFTRFVLESLNRLANKH